MKTRIFFLLAVAALASIETAAQPRRDIADFTTDTLMVHDPVMAFERGVYHVFSTGRGIQHATSKDMKTWTVDATPTMTVIPRWTHDSVPGFRDHVWAPDIIRYKDRWWMSYSCSTFGRNTSAIGLLSTRHLGEGAIWNDEGAIVCTRGGRDHCNAIDGNFVIDENNEPWFSFGSFWDGIQLLKLDSTTMHVDKSVPQRTIARRRVGVSGVPQVEGITTNEKNVSHDDENPIEAPFIFRHGDYYYLFVSWDYCCKGINSTYKTVVGRSRNVAGPYLDDKGVDMAEGGGRLVIEGDKKTFEAAGHSAAYTFGDTDYFICHGYSIEQDGASILICKPIRWTADGWPEI